MERLYSPKNESVDFVLLGTIAQVSIKRAPNISGSFEPKRSRPTNPIQSHHDNPSASAVSVLATPIRQRQEGLNIMGLPGDDNQVLLNRALGTIISQPFSVDDTAAQTGIFVQICSQDISLAGCGKVRKSIRMMQDGRLTFSMLTIDLTQGHIGYWFYLNDAISVDEFEESTGITHTRVFRLVDIFFSKVRLSRSNTDLTIT